MAYYRDLTPYSYSFERVRGVSSEEVRGALNVGWLSRRNLFFSRSQIPLAAVDRLKGLALQFFGQTRGYHSCPFCPFRPYGGISAVIDGREVVLGSAEIVVRSKQGVTYVAPNLIIHYIEKHSYRPPQEFLDALELDG